MNEDYTEKVEFDGRMQYYKVVGLYLLNIGIAHRDRDYDTWLRLLRALFNMVYPFISNKDKKDLHKKLDVLQKKYYTLMNNKFNNNSFQLNVYFDNQLNDVEMQLYNSCKQILVPTRAMEVEEFNEEDFLKRSGK